MPPRSSSKRQRVSSQAGPSSSTASRFLSPEHEERYATFYSGREVIKEKGFLLTPGSCEEIQSYIQDQMWGKLCEPSCTSCPTLVKEFYVNAWDNSGAKPTWRSLVRGKEVSFDLDAIAAYYGIEYYLDHFDYDLYMKGKHRESMQRRVLSSICREGATWINDKAGRPNKLKRVDLKPVAKAWHTFIMYTLLPTSNASEVTIPRAFLLYTIMTRGSVHIGHMIRNHIHKIAQENSQGLLPYPSLITQLCVRAGISTEGEEMFSALKPIDIAALEKYRREFEAICTSTSQAPVQAPSKANPSNSAPPASKPIREHSLEQLVRDLGMHMHAIEQRMDRQFQYSVEAMYSLSLATKSVFRAFRRDYNAYGPSFPIPPVDLMPNFPQEVTWAQGHLPPQPPADDDKGIRGPCFSGEKSTVLFPFSSGFFRC